MDEFEEEFDSTSSSSTDNSSSSDTAGSGESSCEGGESELNESQEERSIPPHPLSPHHVGPSPAIKRKRLRKRKSVGLRKKLRTHIESVSDFNPEARDAQSAELERIRRLKLQQSIIGSEGSGAYTSSEGYVGTLDANKQSQRCAKEEGRVLVKEGGSSPEVMERIDISQSTRGSKLTFDPIVIESGSSDSDSSINYQGQPLPRNTPPTSYIGGHSHQGVRGTGQALPPAPPPRQLEGKYDLVSLHLDRGVVVNVGHPPNELDVFLAPQIARKAKPHQVGGVRFLYDNVIESLVRFDSSPGFGCILAHSMGLGKTMQVISFIDIFLRYTSSRFVLCVVPVNTLQNWVNEFNKWLPPPANEVPSAGGSTEEVLSRRFQILVMSESVKTMKGRLKVISKWRQIGGVLLIGYEMYRLLSLSVPSLGGNKMASKRKKKTPQLTASSQATIDLDQNEKEMETLMAIQHALCNPGPDLVVCDEGHRIKNDYSNISQALKTIRTKRRIVMTGYPLQNNLMEYWCMVDFVRPKYLGTKQEFADLFERPITNGQCVDSNSKDVQLMRYRSHVLHTLLEGFVLRRGHEILQDSLPPKYEHVLFLRPSPVQGTLYNYIINQIKTGPGTASSGPLKAFAMCSKIWNHPDIYYNEVMAQGSRRESPIPWVDDVGVVKMGGTGKIGGGESSMRLDWPKEVIPSYVPERIQDSPKMVVLLELICRSVHLGEKVLVFSQSLATLSYIEKLLSRCQIPIPHSVSQTSGSGIQFSDNKWVKNKNYCRLDGSTNSFERDRLVNLFNSSENTECWVFLLSTKAGCLGINLVGANRVVVMDVSWNPCYDAQAVCRVYRYGQIRPSFIYRLVCDGTMERRMYDRQISKQGMSDRVVDELSPERHLTVNDIITLMAPLANLPEPQDFSRCLNDYKFDPVLMELCKSSGHLLTKLPFKHESLLLDSAEERITEVEKHVAIRSFQQDLKSLRGSVANPGAVVGGAKGVVSQGGPSHVHKSQTPLPKSSIKSETSGSVIPATISSGSKRVEIICLDSSSEEEEETPMNPETKMAPFLAPKTQELMNRCLKSTGGQSTGKDGAHSSGSPLAATPPVSLQQSSSLVNLAHTQVDGLAPFLFRGSYHDLVKTEDDDDEEEDDDDDEGGDGSDLMPLIDDSPIQELHSPDNNTPPEPICQISETICQSSPTPEPFYQNSPNPKPVCQSRPIPEPVSSYSPLSPPSISITSPTHSLQQVQRSTLHASHLTPGKASPSPSSDSDYVSSPDYSHRFKLQRRLSSLRPSGRSSVNSGSESAFRRMGGSPPSTKEDNLFPVSCRLFAEAFSVSEENDSSVINSCHSPRENEVQTSLHVNTDGVPLTSGASPAPSSPYIPLLSPIAARLLYLSTGTSLPSSPPEDVKKFFPRSLEVSPLTCSPTVAISSMKEGGDKSQTTPLSGVILSIKESGTVNGVKGVVNGVINKSVVNGINRNGFNKGAINEVVNTAENEGTIGVKGDVGGAMGVVKETAENKTKTRNEDKVFVASKSPTPEKEEEIVPLLCSPLPLTITSSSASSLTVDNVSATHPLFIQSAPLSTSPNVVSHVTSLRSSSLRVGAPIYETSPLEGGDFKPGISSEPVTPLGNNTPMLATRSETSQALLMSGTSSARRDLTTIADGYLVSSSPESSSSQNSVLQSKSVTVSSHNSCHFAPSQSSVTGITTSYAIPCTTKPPTTSPAPVQITSPPNITANPSLPCSINITTQPPVSSASFPLSSHQRTLSTPSAYKVSLGVSNYSPSCPMSTCNNISPLHSGIGLSTNIPSQSPPLQDGHRVSMSMPSSIPEVSMGTTNNNTPPLPTDSCCVVRISNPFVCDITSSPSPVQFTMDSILSSASSSLLDKPPPVYVTPSMITHHSTLGQSLSAISSQTSPTYSIVGCFPSTHQSSHPNVEKSHNLPLWSHMTSPVVSSVKKVTLSKMSVSGISPQSGLDNNLDNGSHSTPQICNNMQVPVGASVLCRPAHQTMATSLKKRTSLLMSSVKTSSVTTSSRPILVPNTLTTTRYSLRPTTLATTGYSTCITSMRPTSLATTGYSTGHSIGATTPLRPATLTTTTGLSTGVTSLRAYMHTMLNSVVSTSPVSSSVEAVPATVSHMPASTGPVVVPTIQTTGLPGALKPLKPTLHGISSTVSTSDTMTTPGPTNGHMSTLYSTMTTCSSSLPITVATLGQTTVSTSFRPNTMAISGYTTDSSLKSGQPKTIGISRQPIPSALPSDKITLSSNLKKYAASVLPSTSIKSGTISNSLTTKVPISRIPVPKLPIPRLPNPRHPTSRSPTPRHLTSRSPTPRHPTSQSPTTTFTTKTPNRENVFRFPLPSDRMWANPAVSAAIDVLSPSSADTGSCLSSPLSIRSQSSPSEVCSISSLALSSVVCTPLVSMSSPLSSPTRPCSVQTTLSVTSKVIPSIPRRNSYSGLEQNTQVLRRNPSDTGQSPLAMRRTCSSGVGVSQSNVHNSARKECEVKQDGIAGKSVASVGVTDYVVSVSRGMPTSSAHATHVSTSSVQVSSSPSTKHVTQVHYVKGIVQRGHNALSIRRKQNLESLLLSGGSVDVGGSVCINALHSSTANGQMTSELSPHLQKIKKHYSKEKLTKCSVSQSLPPPNAISSNPPNAILVQPHPPPNAISAQPHSPPNVVPVKPHPPPNAISAQPHSPPNAIPTQSNPLFDSLPQQHHMPASPHLPVQQHTRSDALMNGVDSDHRTLPSSSSHLGASLRDASSRMGTPSHASTIHSGQKESHPSTSTSVSVQSIGPLHLHLQTLPVSQPANVAGMQNGSAPQCFCHTSDKYNVQCDSAANMKTQHTPLTSRRCNFQTSQKTLNLVSSHSHLHTHPSTQHNHMLHETAEHVHPSVSQLRQSPVSLSKTGGLELMKSGPEEVGLRKSESVHAAKVLNYLPERLSVDGDHVIVNDLPQTVSEQLQQVLDSAQEFIRLEQLRQSGSPLPHPSLSGSSLHDEAITPSSICSSPLPISIPHYRQSSPVLQAQQWNHVSLSQQVSHQNHPTNSHSKFSEHIFSNSKASASACRSNTLNSESCSSQNVPCFLSARQLSISSPADEPTSPCKLNHSPPKKTAVVAPYQKELGVLTQQDAVMSQCDSTSMSTQQSLFLPVPKQHVVSTKGLSIAARSGNGLPKYSSCHSKFNPGDGTCPVSQYSSCYSTVKYCPTGIPCSLVNQHCPPQTIGAQPCQYPHQPPVTMALSSPGITSSSHHLHSEVSLTTYHPKSTIAMTTSTVTRSPFQQQSTVVKSSPMPITRRSTTYQQTLSPTVVRSPPHQQSLSPTVIRSSSHQQQPAIARTGPTVVRSLPHQQQPTIARTGQTVVRSSPHQQQPAITRTSPTVVRSLPHQQQPAIARTSPTVVESPPYQQQPAVAMTTVGRSPPCYRQFFTSPPPYQLSMLYQRSSPSMVSTSCQQQLSPSMVSPPCLHQPQPSMVSPPCQQQLSPNMVSPPFQQQRLVLASPPCHKKSPITKPDPVNLSLTSSVQSAVSLTNQSSYHCQSPVTVSRPVDMTHNYYSPITMATTSDHTTMVKHQPHATRPCTLLKSSSHALQNRSVLIHQADCPGSNENGFRSASPRGHSYPFTQQSYINLFPEDGRSMSGEVVAMQRELGPLRSIPEMINVTMETNAMVGGIYANRLSGTRTNTGMEQVTMETGGGMVRGRISTNVLSGNRMNAGMEQVSNALPGTRVNTGLNQCEKSFYHLMGGAT